MSEATARLRPPGWAIGIDVGGTKIAGARVDFPEGTVRTSHELRTHPERGPNAVLSDVVTLVGQVQGESSDQGEFIGVGLGVCELVNREGEILSGNCLAWKSAQVADALQKFGRVKIEADVRAAALAESLFGAGKSANPFLYVTVGTGISCCLVVDGLPYSGARGAAGTMASGAFPNLEGSNLRSLEDVAAGPGLVSAYAQGGGIANSAQEVLMAAENGDARAKRVAERGATSLGSAIGWLINVLDPELVILGGGLGLREGFYRAMVEEAAREHIWWDGNKETKIVSAKLGANTGVIGAAAALWAARESRL